LRAFIGALFDVVQAGVSVAPPLSDPELQAEQAYLDEAMDSLSEMRQRAERLLQDLIAAGNPDLDYVAALSRRVSLLAESPRPLLFGRIDEEEGPSWHIGRRHVEDTRAEPVVVDWRAPVAVPFYRASAKDALGLTRRRQIMVDRRTVVAVADDLFGGPEDVGSTRLRGGDALLAELERARTGEMLDIVATIQAEQDEIIRAPLDRLLTVQGGPGTGKTAVGLHRAAFLLYNHPNLSRDGVLVLGPSRAFLRYIAQVLPSLGEEAVVQTTIADIAPKAKVRRQEPMEVRRLKGDPRMATLLQRALEGRRGHLVDDVTLRVRFARATLAAARINDLVASIVARPAPYKAGRLALRARLVSEARRAFRSSGRLGADEPWFEGELTATDEFTALLDTLWPAVSPTALVRDLLSSRAQLQRFGAGLYSDEERGQLLRSREVRVSSTAWSADDLALLDEAAFLTGGRTRTYGHIVIDEAQDLTPMQFRMIARRAPSGSVTVLGDLAQATGPWTYADWGEIRALLTTRMSRPEHQELTLGYRAPGRVLDLASKLLPAAAPGIRPTSSIRPGRTEPTVRPVPVDEVTTAALAESYALSAEYALVAVIAPDELVQDLVRLTRRHDEVGLLEREAMTRPVTIVPAPAAKGLEFDAVVVVEPAAIAGEDRRGLRLLYVALTRPIQHLSIVHGLPLPSPLLD
jgi:DNA helicase IV